MTDLRNRRIALPAIATSALFAAACSSSDSPIAFDATAPTVDSVVQDRGADSTGRGGHVRAAGDGVVAGDLGRVPRTGLWRPRWAHAGACGGRPGLAPGPVEYGWGTAGAFKAETPF